MNKEELCSHLKTWITRYAKPEDGERSELLYRSSNIELESFVSDVDSVFDDIMHCTLSETDTDSPEYIWLVDLLQASELAGVLLKHHRDRPPR